MFLFHGSVTKKRHRGGKGGGGDGLTIIIITFIKQAYLFVNEAFDKKKEGERHS